MQKTFATLFAISSALLSLATPIAVPQQGKEKPWRSYGEGEAKGKLIAGDPRQVKNCQQFCSGFEEANIHGIREHQGTEECICLQYLENARPLHLFSIHSWMPGYVHLPPPGKTTEPGVTDQGDSTQANEIQDRQDQTAPVRAWKRETRFPFYGEPIKGETLTGPYDRMMSGCLELCKNTPNANVLTMSGTANKQQCICFNSHEGARGQIPVGGTAMYVVEGAKIARITKTGGGLAQAELEDKEQAVEWAMRTPFAFKGTKVKADIQVNGDERQRTEKCLMHCKAGGDANALLIYPFDLDQKIDFCQCYKAGGAATIRPVSDAKMFIKKGATILEDIGDGKTTATPKQT